jgi:hypothetical protein
MIDTEPQIQEGERNLADKYKVTLWTYHVQTTEIQRQKNLERSQKKKITLPTENQG